MTASVSGLHLCQILRQYFYPLPACNPPSDLRIKRIDGITAGALNIVLLVPFKTWNKEQRQAHISHEDLVSAVGAATVADDRLVIFKIFSSLGNSHHEKHGNDSPDSCLLLW